MSDRTESEKPVSASTVPPDALTEQDRLIFQAPLSTIEWLGGPLVLLGFSALGGYLGLQPTHGSASTPGAVVVLVGVCLASVAAIFVGIFGYRYYLRVTPSAARAYFRVFAIWWSCNLANLIVVAIVAHQPLLLGFVFLAGCGILLSLKRRHARKSTVDLWHTTQK